jgi:hypothetical protein
MLGVAYAPRVYGYALEAPVALVTMIGAEPADPAGTTAEMSESLMTCQFDALVAPNLTPVVATVPVNPLPVIVTVVPTD